MGAGTVEILTKNREIITNRVGTEVVVRKIADLDIESDRGVQVGRDLLTKQAMDIIDDPEIHIVVELIGGIEKAKEYISRQKPPIVVKADGLAAGKGVIIAESIPEALEALRSIMKDRKLRAAGDVVVVEEYLSGKEISFFAFTDGRAVVPMVPACDYKRIGDGDRGPNTGGMGTYSPPLFYTPELADKVMKIANKRLVKRHIEGPMGVRGRKSDNDLIYKKLGWKPMAVLASGLEKTYTWVESEVKEQRKKRDSIHGKIKVQL